MLKMLKLKNILCTQQHRHSTPDGDTLFNSKYHFPHCHPLCMVLYIRINTSQTEFSINFQFNIVSISLSHHYIRCEYKTHCTVGTYVWILFKYFCYLYICFIYASTYYMWIFCIVVDLQCHLPYSAPSSSQVYIDEIHKFISLCFVIEFLILYYCVRGGRLMLGNSIQQNKQHMEREQQTIDRVEWENM